MVKIPYIFYEHINLNSYVAMIKLISRLTFFYLTSFTPMLESRITGCITRHKTERV